MTIITVLIIMKSMGQIVINLLMMVVVLTMSVSLMAELYHKTMIQFAIVRRQFEEAGQLVEQPLNYDNNSNDYTF